MTRGLCRKSNIAAGDRRERGKWGQKRRCWGKRRRKDAGGNGRTACRAGRVRPTEDEDFPVKLSIRQLRKNKLIKARAAATAYMRTDFAIREAF